VTQSSSRPTVHVGDEDFLRVAIAERGDDRTPAAARWHVAHDLARLRGVDEAARPTARLWNR
jgi:hypothetical protein